MALALKRGLPCSTMAQKNEENEERMEEWLKKGLNDGVYGFVNLLQSVFFLLRGCPVETFLNEPCFLALLADPGSSPGHACRLADLPDFLCFFPCAPAPLRFFPRSAVSMQERSRDFPPAIPSAAHHHPLARRIRYSWFRLPEADAGWGRIS